MMRNKHVRSVALAGALLALTGTTTFADAQAPAKPAPWDGFWECTVPIEPLRLEIRNGRYSIRGSGTQAPRNPFGGPPSGAITPLKGHQGGRILSIPGLTSKRNPGIWFWNYGDRQYRQPATLTWFIGDGDGEGAERMCQRVGR